jgi:hypothetical protein
VLTVVDIRVEPAQHIGNEHLHLHHRALRASCREGVRVPLWSSENSSYVSNQDQDQGCPVRYNTENYLERHMWTSKERVELEG